MSSAATRHAPPLLVMHIPKTAGTSLRWVAQRQYRRGALVEIYPGRPEQIEAFVAERRAAPAVIGHFRFGLHARLAAGGRYVTFLREPVAQVVSHFNYLAGHPGTEHGAQLAPDDTLEAFLAHPWARNLQTQYVTGWVPAEIEAEPDAAFARALAVIDAHFAGVGVVERLAESLHALAPALGWRHTRVPRLNPSPPGPRAIRPSDLAPALARAVEAANAVDRRLYAALRERAERAIAAAPPPPRVAAARAWLAGWLDRAR